MKATAPAIKYFHLMCLTIYPRKTGNSSKSANGDV